MFEEFLGNTELKIEISERIDSGSLPHALVFSGDDGTGCDYFSRLVAQEYLKDKNGLVMRNVHPDYLLVQGSGASGQVAVSDVREALYEMNKAAVMTDGNRVVHIRQAENLNTNSANALLKMMEEPPDGVIFILTVKRLDDLLPTLQSRSVHYRIKPLSVDECAQEAVSRTGMNKEQSRNYSELFGGRLGLVLRTANDQRFLFCVQTAERFLDSALKKNRYGMMESLSQAEDREQLSEILRIILSGVSVLIQNSPDNAGFPARIFEYTSDALEQNDSFINSKTACAVLAAKISKARI